MRTSATGRGAGVGIVAVAVGVLLAGCQMPDPASSPGLDIEQDTGNGTPFTDPLKAEIYDELTRPLPYSGGDMSSRCGAWSAATPEDARAVRTAHQRCLDEGATP